MSAQPASDDVTVEDEVTAEEIARDEALLAPYILSREEGRAYFDGEARRRLGISGDEFLRRLDAGEIVDDDTNWNITALVMMLPFVRVVES